MKWTVWFVLAVAALAAEDSAKNDGKQWLHETKTDHVDFAPGGTIQFLNAHGDLNISGWDKPEVEVTVIKSTGNLYPPKDADALRKRLGLITVKLDRKSATELDIPTLFPSRTLMRLVRGKSDLMLEYQVHVPRQSHLVIRQDIGAVIISGVAGNMEAHLSKGDIVVLMDGPEPYSVDARSSFGGVQSDQGGAAAGHLGHQRLSFAPPSAKYKLLFRVGIGDINVKHTPESH
jgi:hypothetical protein